MVVGDAKVFPCFLTAVLINTTFFPKPQTTSLTCFSTGERRKYTGKKVLLDRVSNSQPPGHESDTLTTDIPEQRIVKMTKGIIVLSVKEFRAERNREGVCSVAVYQKHLKRLGELIIFEPW